ncbi:MAG: LapA family protein [Mycobacterium sp.]
MKVPALRHIGRGLVGDDQVTARNADEPPQDSETAFGLFVVGAAVLAWVVCMGAFALGEVGAGVSAAIVGLLAFGAGLAWLAMDRRRIRQTERELIVRHRAR